MANKFNELREDFVGTAVGVVILIVVAVSGALAITGLILIGYDLVASYHAWGEKIALLVNLPNQKLFAVVVTSLPTLIQLAYFSSKVAAMQLSDNAAFRYLFWASLALDTTLDTYQMQQGGIASISASVFVAIFFFGWMSEFLVVFAGSVFAGLVYRFLNEDGLLEMALEDTKSRATGQSGQGRGRKN